MISPDLAEPVTTGPARPLAKARAGGWFDGQAAGGDEGPHRPRSGSDHGGQVIWALTAVATPAVTWAVAKPGWQPARLAMTV